MKKIFAALLLACFSVAALGSGVSGLRVHDHSNAQQGGKGGQVPLFPVAGGTASLDWPAIRVRGSTKNYQRFGVDIWPAESGTFDLPAIRIASHPYLFGRILWTTYPAPTVNSNLGSRWFIEKTDDEPESGGNTGGNWGLGAVKDDGTSHTNKYAIFCRRTDNSCRFGGSVLSQKVCATGYTRIGPNYCARTGAAVLVFNATGANACAQSGTASLTDATAVQLEIRQTVYSTNTLNNLAQGVVGIAGSADTTCATTLQTSTTGVVEFTALAATPILQGGSTMIVETDTAGRFYYKTTGTTAATVNAGYVVGYFD